MKIKETEYWRGVKDAVNARLEAARTRLERADAERQEIVNEIVQLERLVQSLSPFTTGSPSEQSEQLTFDLDVGLADACRRVLQHSDRHMTPMEVRNALEASNFTLEPYSNPLASIHGVLKRFKESGEAEQTEVEGRTFYRRKDTGSHPRGVISKRTFAAMKNPMEPQQRTREEAIELQKRALEVSKRRRAEARAAIDRGKSQPAQRPYKIKIDPERMKVTQKKKD